MGSGGCLRRLVGLTGIVLHGAVTFAGGVLTLATTTSTENSGLLAHIHPRFEQMTNITVKVIARGTGASLQLAREGNADVILVHAREQEDMFLRDGYGALRRDVMHNDFVIVGPASDPATIRGLRSPIAALERIASARALFISRGDSSGTHSKEQALWKDTRVELVERTCEIVRKGKTLTLSMVRPGADWYRSIGQGMGKTIGYATEKQGYCLTDRGTYYAYALGPGRRSDLVVLCEGDARLANPYGVIAVNPARFPHVKHGAALTYIEWITSSEVQAMIGNYRKDGKVLFHPSAGTSNVTQ